MFSFIEASSFENWKPKYLTDDEYAELQFFLLAQPHFTGTAYLLSTRSVWGYLLNTKLKRHHAESLPLLHFNQ